jgi:murein L,D-transpeptidase YcbB/YkuD
MKMGIIAAALSALVVQPGIASAQAPAQQSLTQLPYQSANLPTAGEVGAVYAGWRYAPIWFNGAAAKPAVNDLLAILQRAPLDGVAAGPQYAAQLQAAVQQAATGSPQAIAFAEHSLSEALVLYAHTMDRPVQGMTYGYEYLKPKMRSASELLRIASATPSLEGWLRELANPNPIYASIRDAAWKQMQASGTAVADPRVIANLDLTRGMPAKGRFVMVNSANQMLYMYQDGMPVGSMKIVVGDNGQYLKNRPIRGPRWSPA